MVKQEVTYYKDYTTKTYKETSDGVLVVFKRFDKHGNLTYAKYGTGEWERWKFDYHKQGFRVAFQENHKGEYLLRRFNEEGRMIYEETHEGCTYDPTKPKNK